MTAQRLFTIDRMPVFVDAMQSGLERRAGGHDAKVLRLTCRIEPFTAAQAGDLDDGLGGDSNVRPSCFKITTGEPKPHIERVAFTLDCPRQRLDLYASPDTDTSRLCFDHVKISGFYVRTAKDTGALAAVFTATFGPVGRDELEAAHHAVRSQTFITFLEAEPSLAFDETETLDAPAPAPVRVPPYVPDEDDRDESDDDETDGDEELDNVVPPPAFDELSQLDPADVFRDVDERDVFAADDAPIAVPRPRPTRARRPTGGKPTGKPSRKTVPARTATRRRKAT